VIKKIEKKIAQFFQKVAQTVSNLKSSPNSLQAQKGQNTYNEA
jgi:hypothetical protein